MQDVDLPGVGSESQFNAGLGLRWNILDSLDARAAFKLLRWSGLGRPQAFFQSRFALSIWQSVRCASREACSDRFGQ